MQPARRQPSATPRSASCVEGNDDRSPGDRTQSFVDEIIVSAGESIIVVASSFAGDSNVGDYRLTVTTAAPNAPPSTDIAEPGATAPRRERKITAAP